MTFTIKEGLHPGYKFIYQDSFSIGAAFWAHDGWYFSSKYTDDFYSADQLHELSVILCQLNTTIPDPFDMKED